VERYARVNGAALFVRAVGDGVPVIVLHGGPDFDHYYLRPELDRLAGPCRLIYYDQRGRGRSAAGVQPDDVSIDSDLADLDAVRQSFGVSSVAVLGHSWGGMLAAEYATRHPGAVSRLILMNTAPVSSADWLTFRNVLADRRRGNGDLDRLRTIAASDGYLSGDPAADLDYYRVHFRLALDDDALERVLPRLRAHFTAPGVLMARAIEHRLYGQTWERPNYDLIPKLRRLEVPTLVLHGEHDFVPLEVVVRIADAMPRARLAVLAGCGHFAYLEQPEAVREHVCALLSEC
jgi:proline-specific peptidase